MLRRIEHVPIATAVRLPNADAAPIGRVLDAGADAVVIAMIESADEAAAAVAATRYPPAGVRSFGPLRASLGYDTAALESRVSVFAMIETAAALSWPQRDLRRRRAGRTLCRARRSGPLDGRRCRRRNQDIRPCWTPMGESIARRPMPGWSPGFTPGDGKTGRAMAQLGFRMITLAAESQALRRGAAEHLREATGQ